MRKSCIFEIVICIARKTQDSEIQLVSGTSTEIQLVDKCSDIINSSTRNALTDSSLSPLQLVSGTSTEIQLVDKCSDIINSSTRDALTDSSLSPHVEPVTSTIIPNPVVVVALFTTSNQSFNLSTDTSHCLATLRKSPL